MTNSPTLARKEIFPPTSGSQTRMKKVEPLTEQNIFDRIQNKTVLFVFCDSHYDDATKFLSEMSEHQLLPKGVKTIKWSNFVDQLPSLSADIILINSLPPSTLIEGNNLISVLFKDFKVRNPTSAISMVNLYGFITPAGQVFGSLSRENLVDEIHEGPISYQHLLHKGVCAFESKSC